MPDSSSSPRYGSKQPLSARLRRVLADRGLRYVLSRSFFWTRRRAAYRIRRLVAPLVVRTLPRRTFEYRGDQYNTFHHTHNFTWRNERATEVPIALGFLQGQPSVVGHTQILEIGRVLPHYVSSAGWRVVDLIESGPGVINTDFVDYETDDRYFAIVSISTIEHIGIDDGTDSPDRVLMAIRKIRELLAPGGQALVTFANGYNRYLDLQVIQDPTLFDRLDVLTRTGQRDWISADHPAAAIREATYGAPFEGGNTVTFGYVIRPEPS